MNEYRPHLIVTDTYVRLVLKSRPLLHSMSDCLSKCVSVRDKCVDGLISL